MLFRDSTGPLLRKLDSEAGGADDFELAGCRVQRKDAAALDPQSRHQQLGQIGAHGLQGIRVGDGPGDELENVDVDLFFRTHLCLHSQLTTQMVTSLSAESSLA